MWYCWYACKHHTSLNVHDCFHTRVVCPLGKASPPKERPKTSLGGRLQVTSENETQNKTKQNKASSCFDVFFAETVLFSAATAASTRLRLGFDWFSFLNQASSEWAHHQESESRESKQHRPKISENGTEHRRMSQHCILQNSADKSYISQRKRLETLYTW